MGQDDILFYADSGSEFIENMDDFFCLQQNLKQDIVIFQLEHIEREFTKADAFLLMQCDWQRCKDTPQFSASFISLMKTFETAEFVGEWLTYVQDSRIITPQESIFAVNPRNFKEHRHDQSVLSILAKKWGVEAWPDISQYGQEGTLRFDQKFETINKNFIAHTRNKE